MEKTTVIQALKEARANSKQRKFRQSFDFVMALKGLDLKKPEHQVDSYVSIPHGKGKKAKICAIVGAELLDNAKKNTDHHILIDNIANLKKGEIKALARDYDYFIAQANVMPKLATSLGKIFGPRGKMPNPKAGCIVPPNANLAPLVERLQKTIRVTAKTSPVVHCCAGTEEQKDEEVADNILAIYTSILKSLPNEKDNIKNVFVKLTMGKPVNIEEKQEKQDKK